jgi:hypothetical protein
VGDSAALFIHEAIMIRSELDPRWQYSILAKPLGNGGWFFFCWREPRATLRWWRLRMQLIAPVLLGALKGRLRRPTPHGDGIYMEMPDGSDRWVGALPKRHK